MSAASVVSRRFIRPQTGARRRRIVNLCMLSFTALLTILILIPLFWIIGYVIYKGGPYVNWDFFTQLPRPLGMTGGGVLHSIQGTLVLTALAAIFAIPPGVITAFYTARNPNTPLGMAVRFGTDVLAGVPSIVIGLFGYALIVKPQGHFSALAGSVALAIIMLPTIIRTTEEMIKLTPHSLREGSLAVGAPEWKTMLDVVFPAAFNGIITGFLLGLARAAGETAPLLFTALGNDNFEIGRLVSNGLAAGQSPWLILTRLFSQPIDSLPLTLWKYAQQPYPERVNQAWAAALVLMLVVLLINIVARLWVVWRTRKLQG